MRDLKFRGWNGHSILPVSVINQTYEKMYSAVGSIYCPTMLSVELANGDYLSYDTARGSIPLMQFIGITDKEGVGIYEDDLVEFSKSGVNYKAFTVRYSKELLTYVAEYNSALFLLTDVSNLQVVGNIYENPELVR